MSPSKRTKRIFQSPVLRTGSTFAAPDSTTFSFSCRAPFAGGSASTQALSPDVERIHTADNFRQVLAFDRDCGQVYSVDVGEQVFGSIAVSSTGRELHAAAETRIYKIVENADRRGAAIAFTSNVFRRSFVPPTTTLPNGASNYSRGRSSATTCRWKTSISPPSAKTASPSSRPSGSTYPRSTSARRSSWPSHSFGRETGLSIDSTPSREETASVVATGADGPIVLANSPIRRLLTFALLDVLNIELQTDPDATAFLTDYRTSVLQPLTGGLTRYAAAGRFDLFARDASCAAANRLDNFLSTAETVTSEARRADAANAGSIHIAAQRGELERRQDRWRSGACPEQRYTPPRTG